jgi:hypothetical protein
MEPITPRNRNRAGRSGDRQVTPEVYWRRRVFALAGGLAVLGLLAWSIGGAASHPMASTTSFNQPQPKYTPTYSPSPAASSPSPHPSPSRSSPSPSATRRGARHHPLAAGLNAPGDDCPAGAVVVSLAASGDSFAGAARPEFTITVVSTTSRICQFNVGSRYLTLVIESGGVREWGSGDCVKGGGTRVAMLARGVPVQRRLGWNRTLSSPGCRLPATPAGPGTYTATASDAGVHSRTVVFLLR